MSTDTLEITDLETLWNHDLNCEARHLSELGDGSVEPMELPCSIVARWLFRDCTQRKLVCDSFHQEAVLGREMNLTVCIYCNTVCERFVEL